MDERHALAALRRYALDQLAADRYPNDHHVFRPYGCATCGVIPLAVTIEHHSGSQRGRFKGAIDGICQRCGRSQRIFSFTNPNRHLVRQERPACSCGHAFFLVAECERIEGEEGLAGFADEGVVVAGCAACGRPRVLVATD